MAFERLAASASLLFLTALTASGLGCGSNHSEERPRDGGAIVATSLEKVRPDIGKFSILKAEPEGLPDQISRELGYLKGARAVAQRLPTVSPQIWAVPAVGRLCLVEVAEGRAGSVACTRLARAAKAGIYIASVPSGAPGASDFRTVVGLVPDGVKRVRLHAKGARPQTAPVAENVFALRDHGRAFPESIELVRAR